jgi:hypothetical protein
MQREMTVHYFKTWRVVNTEHFKNFESFFKCSRKTHQALWWNWLSWGPPQEWKTLRIISLVTSQNKCFRVQVTDTSQHQLFRGIRPSWNFDKETTTKGHRKEEETCLGQETQAMEIRPVKMCTLVSPNWRLMVLTAVSLWDMVWVNGWSPHVHFPT